jgi:hypothetical protein
MWYWVFLASIIMMSAGWAFFREPGVPFWGFAPVWRASRYVRPAGAILWVGGALLGVPAALVLLGRWLLAAGGWL